jgi:hypothetical protein
MLSLWRGLRSVFVAFSSLEIVFSDAMVVGGAAAAKSQRARRSK